MTKKIMSFLCTAIILYSLLISAARADYVPFRVIHVVFDDSGSMFLPEETNDSWCQAKYAMEVFAGLLGARDSMNIYVMSDYEKGRNAPPKLSLDGGNDAAANIAAVHDMPVAGMNTKFDSVRKAYADLVDARAEEKWLVVLTDGEFQGIDDKDAFFSGKEPDIRVMFVNMMGKDEWGIAPKPENSIFYQKVASAAEIPSTITDLCRRIFNRQKLDTLSFDIPMSELVVFAQGADVAIHGIKTGDTVIPRDTVASVRYSDTPAESYKAAKRAVNLTGKIAAFTGDFDAGDYTLDVTGHETLEIYYKPNIDVRAFLSDAAGSEVTNMDKLESGAYYLNFGFVKKDTDERVPQSELLGTVQYSAVVTNNGTAREYAAGEQIVITEGELSVAATARYMDYNTVVTTRSYRVYHNKGLSFAVAEAPEYTIQTDGFSGEVSPIVVKAQIENEDGVYVDFTPEQWAAMGIPEVVPSDPKAKIGGFRVEKSGENGLFNLYPTVYSGGAREQAVGDLGFQIAHSQIVGDATWSNAGTPLTFSVADGFSWWDRNGQTVMFLFACLSFLLLIVWIMTRKVYPGTFRVREVHFTVRNREMTVNDVSRCCVWNVRRGLIGFFVHLFVSEPQAIITVDKPPGFTDPLLGCRTTITICPVSRRITPPRVRRIGICAPIRSTAHVSEIQIGTVYERHKLAPNTLVPLSEVEKEIQAVAAHMKHNPRETDFNGIEMSIGTSNRLEIRMI
ncbi:MAG: hypothetical protein LBH54_01120 [Clostridiales bacterium]|jgi:hypothetical protein|nr:hypothetical protein [Clostridiales bacterium]